MREGSDFNWPVVTLPTYLRFPVSLSVCLSVCAWFPVGTYLCAREGDEMKKPTPKNVES